MKAALLTSVLVFSCLSAHAQQTSLQKKDEVLAPPKNIKTKLPLGYTIPVVDISSEKARQVIVDRG